MPLSSGARLGPYEILVAIGAGGMGEVYRARDTQLKRDVALKVLPAEVATDPDRLARFQREAELLAALNHPHICTIYDIGEQAGQHYLAMELLEGETLKQRVLAKRLAVSEMLALALEVADARGHLVEHHAQREQVRPPTVRKRDGSPGDAPTAAKARVNRAEPSSARHRRTKARVRLA